MLDSVFQSIEPSQASASQVLLPAREKRRVALYGFGSTVAIGTSFTGVSSDAFNAGGAGRYLLPPQVFQVVTLPEGESLYARAGGADTMLSVAVSYRIPRSLRPPVNERGARQALFATVDLPNDQRVPLILPGPSPQRCVFLVEATGRVRLTFRPAMGQNNLILAADQHEFVLDAPASGPRVFVFVKPPHQTIYAKTVPFALGGGEGDEILEPIEHVTTVSFHSTDIPVGELRGTTGIPGPDGQE